MAITTFSKKGGLKSVADEKKEAVSAEKKAKAADMKAEKEKNEAAAAEKQSGRAKFGDAGKVIDKLEEAIENGARAEQTDALAAEAEDLIADLPEKLREAAELEIEAVLEKY